MNEIYVILVAVLFALAIADIIVGITNDASNFLTSAFSSKSAPKWLIFSIAGLGIIAGSLFSTGMMEVARTGFFIPEKFVFTEVMIIFLAVMVTDVVLLEFFNSVGFPTSTTVSIVFELLGASVSVALTKIAANENINEHLGQYINSDKALIVIGGILSSVVLAFVIGAVIQRIIRILFSFRYQKRLKYFGSLFGGVSIALIIHFLVVRGAFGSAIITNDTANFLTSNSCLIFAINTIVSTILLQLLSWFTKINILKVVVLIGTFALAWSFAGNDLVNFIGVPLAGYSAYEIWASSGCNPETFNMGALAGEVHIPTIFLLLSGLAMTATLLLSKKTKKVLKTSFDLSRQSEGDERLGTSPVSRMIVKGSVRISESINSLIPKKINSYIEKQLTPVNEENTVDSTETPSFDMIRATTNLVIASILISIGTSHKLPLSTTYVTFIVAMGSSLADKAWDRESAVYRISGVIAVIGGWFLTAFLAFILAFIIAKFLLWGKLIATITLLVISALIIIRTNISLHKVKSTAKSYDDEDLESSNIQRVIDKCNNIAIKSVIYVSKTYYLCLEGFFNEDKRQLKDALAEAIEFNAKAKKKKDNVYRNIQQLKQESVDTGHFYVQMVDYVREMAHSLKYFVEPVCLHFENNHKPFTSEQIDQLRFFDTLLTDFFNHSLYILKEKKFDRIDELIEERNMLLQNLKDLEKDQIKRIKNNEVSTRNSVLFFNVISESKNLLLYMINAIKSQRDFMNSIYKNEETTKVN